MPVTNSERNQKCQTGIAGLDEVMGGGLPAHHLFLLQGKPGTGKTTLAMQFLLEGVRQKEKVLYITFSETKYELESVAESHGWDLSNVTIIELSTITSSVGSSNTLFHSSEVEMGEVINLLFEKVKEINPTRVVFDSLSEVRLLAETSLKYRRQMLGFKQFFQDRNVTVLLLDDMTTEAGDLHIQSIVHGVLLLEKNRANYGVERRQLHIVKMRGVAFRGGAHDYLILRGGLKVFPRLVSSEFRERDFKKGTIKSGIRELDDLLGGGLDRGTSNLILGPAGSGKSTIALRFALAAADQGLKVAFYSFEESVATLIDRSKALNLNLSKHIESGRITIRKVEPAELTPGQFTALVRDASDDQSELIVIDSLNGYVHAMPEAQFLILQLHELLSFLGSQGVVSLVILAQAGIMGSMQSPLDLTYLADSVILTRYFEAFGSVKKAISIIKKRSGAHEETLREFRIGEGGIILGKVLSEFSGIFSGIPKFTGSLHQIIREDEAAE